MVIEDLVADLSKNPFHPPLNFAVAVEYESLNQHASAVSFYLRAIEFGNEQFPEITYISLIKLAKAFDSQINRETTVAHALLQAIAYVPNRPEAYFLLSRHYERAGRWQECYSWAVVGLYHAKVEPLLYTSDYHGAYCLEFEKAVSAYWIGRKEESITLFLKLLKQNITPEYRKSVEFNLRTLNVIF